jgi:hypothetical protein
MPINYLTGEAVMSFDDLKALAIIYQTVKLDVIPKIESEARRKVVERGLEVMRNFWVHHKSITAPLDYYGTTDPIRWLNT